MKSFLDGKVQLHCGDMLAVLPTLAENLIDSCVCDPPYHLTSIVKRFGADDAAPAKIGKTGAYARASSGFMGKQWDGGDIAFQVETWAQVLRVLKPGAHLIAFSSTRTYHRMACAIEDAGFEIRDQVGWCSGSGFPPSPPVSKALERANGVKGSFGEAKTPAHERYISKGELRGDRGHDGWQRPWMDDPEAVANAGRKYIGGSDAAREWEGWGTALKPAWEPIVLARKPLSEPTIAANVLKWGTGALSIDKCRIGTDGGTKGCDAGPSNGILGDGLNGSFGKLVAGLGRWPANIIHDGSEEVLAGFPETTAGSDNPRNNQIKDEFFRGKAPTITYGHADNGGSAARFFYTAKADSDDRLGSKHPTVKPLDLMQYLVRLVTPPQGTVLDCFAGTGTTGEAAWREGFSAVLIEREAEYQADIERRMGLVLGGPDERARAAIKERLKDKPQDAGPLFAARTPEQQQAWNEMWSKPFDYPERL